MWCHPGVAEQVLLQHPSVAEACVVGGEGGAVAHLVLADGVAADAKTEAAPRSLCVERLEVHARPSAIEFVASLPRNPGGKIMRYRLTGPASLAQR